MLRGFHAKQRRIKRAGRLGNIRGVGGGVGSEGFRRGGGVIVHIGFNDRTCGRYTMRKLQGNGGVQEFSQVIVLEPVCTRGL